MITDLHCHVLPGMDDGSRSVEESLRMLRMEAEQGVRRIAATPHFYPGYDTPDAFLERRTQAEQLLRRETMGITGLPKLDLGAEVYFFRGMSESDAMMDLTMYGKRCILVELPMGRWDEEIYRELDRLAERRGVIPIIAHIDRYIAPFRTRGIPEKLAQMPVMVQANAEFFLNRKTAGLAMRMLASDRIQLLGSDSHNIKDRAPNLAPAVESIRRKLGREALVRIRRNEREIMGTMPVCK